MLITTKKDQALAVSLTIGCILGVLVIIYNTSNFLYNLDLKLFLAINKLCLSNNILRQVVAWLSHKHESWINVLVMLGINFGSWLGIYYRTKAYSKLPATKVLDLILYCWASFQLVLLLNNCIFHKILEIHRNSPSIVAGEALKLAEILANPAIKDHSNNSFPAGHTLVLIYWTLFINLYATRSIKFLAWGISGILIIPRIVTGAHWISDTIFSIGLAWIYFELALWVANNYAQIKNRLY